ncbi:MAG: hypothetical protein AAGG51_13365 [Cyanobacteria bacterium P01_G01_bin.54]
MKGLPKLSDLMLTVILLATIITINLWVDNLWGHKSIGNAGDNGSAPIFSFEPGVDE